MISNGSMISKIKEKDFHELTASIGIPQQASLQMFAAYKEIAKARKDGKEFPRTNIIRHLEDKWYASLKDGKPWYEVYSQAYYTCDLWLCWVFYSRKALYALKSPTSFISKSIVSAIGNPRAIVDLGCGFGYTTAILKELFPNTEVYGTNISTSFQFRVAAELAKTRMFKLVDSIEKTPTKFVDVILASEYFEHFEDPFTHLRQIMSICKPKWLIVANGFNGRAIGHFNEYILDGKKISNKEASKKFNELLKSYGYEKQKTKLWNNRPSIWMRRI